MKKTIFTFRKQNLSWISNTMLVSLILLLQIGVVQRSWSQCTLDCTSSTQISLNENCEALVTPDMVLNGADSSCPAGQFKVIVKYNGVVIPTSPLITSAYINKVVEITVIDTLSGNSCWGTKRVEDKLPPTIDCKVDTFNCYDMYNWTGPTVTDNCTPISGIKLNILDERIFPQPCAPDSMFIKKIERDYQAVDAQGNKSAVCTSVVWLKRIKLDSVKAPANWLLGAINPPGPIPPITKDSSAIACTDVLTGKVPTLPNGAPHWNYTGVPTVGGFALYPPTDVYCNVSAFYNDIYLGKVGCTEKWIRIWTVQELCGTTTNVKVINQGIEVADTVPPVITCPDNITVTTSGGYKCQGDVWLPVPQAYDSCQGNNITIDVVYPGGFIHDMKAPQVVQLPAGIHTVTYRVYDARNTKGCYNMDSCSIQVTVQDKTSPVAVCIKNTTVSLTYDSTVHVYADVFDAGSYDDCCVDYFEVRRMDNGAPCGQNEGWRKFVEFCCEDVGKTIMVGFRVWDCNKNSNTCMVEIEVQDKQGPTISCPPDLIVPCTYKFEIDSLDKYFGKVVDNKYKRKTYSLYGPFTQIRGGHDLSFCGLYATTIYKNGDKFYPTVAGSSNCNTKTKVTLYEDRAALDITSFKDGVAHDNCNVTITSEYTDFRNQCGVGLIRRGFHASDGSNPDAWCYQYIYFVNPKPFNADNNQIIWPQDKTLVGCMNPNDIDTTVTGVPKFVAENECNLVGFDYTDEVYKFFNANVACFKVVRKWRVIDWCQFTKDKAGNNVYPQWTWDQVIKIIDNVDPTFTQLPPADTSFCSYDPTCTSGPVRLVARGADNCTPGNEIRWEYHLDLNCDNIYDETKTGLGDSIVIDKNLPLGSHCIKFIFEDRCGNRIVRSRTFKVINCKAPTAYCKSGIVINLMPMDTDGDGTPDAGMLDVWASDVDNGSSGVCGNPITLSFSSDTTVKSIRYTCDSLGQRTVNLWVTDKLTGNQSFCKTKVIVQDNNGVCTSPLKKGTIQGLISNVSDEGLSGVGVDVVVSNLPTTLTTSNGKYKFPKMPFGGSYEVKASMSSNPLKGVNTRDLVAIQLHLLGRKVIKNPYLLIAADANQNGSISTADITVLRRLILGRTNNLPNNNSWRFVDKGYQFPDPNSPWGFPETYHLDPFVRDMDNVDFVGVKIGDLTMDNGANGLKSGSTTRGKATLNLETSDVTMTQGQVVEIPFTAVEAAKLAGMQLGFNFDTHTLRFEGYRSGKMQLTADNFGVRKVLDGALLMSWNNAKGVQVKEGEILFTLKFSVVGQAASLSDVLRLSSDDLSAEAYNTTLDISNVSLRFTDDRASKPRFVLYQNVPNPFVDETAISFELPEAAPARLTIYSVDGKVALIRKVDGVKGMNTITISSDELNGSGVMYYQLDTDGFTGTKKMVIFK